MLGALTVLAFAGCATTSPEASAAFVRPLEAGVTRPLSELQAEAASGDPQAQLALYAGLRSGRATAQARPEDARAWLLRAAASRGYRPLAIYIAGLKGRSGRVTTTLIPEPGVSAAQLAAIETCLELLEGRRSPEVMASSLDRGACGGQAGYDRLAALWRSSANLGEAR